MRISVFGMGYVGCVSAACLSAMGHDRVAVEPTETKVKMINQGRRPVIELRLNQLIASSVATGKLRAGSDWASAVRDSELAIVCVGTPSQANGNIDLSAIVRVCEQIGQALAVKREYFTVVIRSTSFRGTVRGLSCRRWRTVPAKRSESISVSA